MTLRVPPPIAYATLPGCAALLEYTDPVDPFDDGAAVLFPSGLRRDPVLRYDRGCDSTLDQEPLKSVIPSQTGSVARGPAKAIAQRWSKDQRSTAEHCAPSPVAEHRLSCLVATECVRRASQR